MGGITNHDDAGYIAASVCVTKQGLRTKIIENSGHGERKRLSKTWTGRHDVAFLTRMKKNDDPNGRQ
jgi:hypothetical protein